jgi:hypothetical protein
MMDQAIVEQVSPNPLLADFELPLRRTYYPLGFPLELETNSMDVIQAASEAWSRFSQAFDETPVRICLGVRATESARTLPPNSLYRSREHLMFVVADPDNFMVCDFSKDFAFGYVARPVARDHPLLRYRFLTAAALMLVEQRALAPIHGALIARNGVGVALLGESFAGKSTLAYACARAGWTFIADDGTMLVRNRRDRYAIGDPYTIRYREDAKQLFPELEHHVATARPNGKIGLEVFTRELPITIAPGSTIEHVVFLRRDKPGPTRLLPYPKDEAVAWCERACLYGVDVVRAAQRRSYKRLSGAGMWEMCYRDLDAAVARLEQLVEAE